MFFISGGFPSFFESYDRALAHGGKHPGIGHAILAVAPAAMAFWLWYKVLKILAKALNRSKDGGNGQAVQLGAAPADVVQTRR